MAEPGEPTPDELVEQIRALRVSDMLMSAFSAVAQLTYAKLEPASRDLAEARLGIDALRALLPIVEEAAAGADEAPAFRQLVASLQLAYADAAAEPRG